MNSEKKYVQMIISIDEHFFTTTNSNFNICFRLILIRYDHDIFQILYSWSSMVNVYTGIWNTFYNLRVVGIFKAFSFHKPVRHNFKSSSVSINKIFHSSIVPHIFKIFMTENTFRSRSNFSQIQLESLPSHIYHRPITFKHQKIFFQDLRNLISCVFGCMPMRNIWIRRFILLKWNWRICPRHRWWFIRPQRHLKILLNPVSGYDVSKIAPVYLNLSYKCFS